MTDIMVHIGLPGCGAGRLQRAMDEKRKRLLSYGVLFARSPGGMNHTRLFMAASAPERDEFLRRNRGFLTPERQADLARQLRDELAAEIARDTPDTLILSAEQLGGGLVRRDEIERLRDLIAPLGQVTRVVAHVDEQARLLARSYLAQILAGRQRPLRQELDLAARVSGAEWAEACRALWDELAGRFPEWAEADAPPHWLDFTTLADDWDAVFGPGVTRLRPYDAALFNSREITREVRKAFDIEGNIGKIDAFDPPPPPSDAWLERARLLNGGLARLRGLGRVIPSPMQRRFLAELSLPGPALAPGALHPVSRCFRATNAALVARFPDLAGPCLTPDTARDTWDIPDPERGFRASQYLAAFLPRIEATTRLSQRKSEAPQPAPHALSPGAEALLSPSAKTRHAQLCTGPFAPHNHHPGPNETATLPPFPTVARAPLPDGSTGKLIVCCMKNEGPYLLEWIAYHRMIGVDSFLIYTNHCEDGTDALLDRLQQMGIVEHRNNDDWHGNSPQQCALNKAMDEPVLKNADWIIHIDVDEYINVRCGRGMIDDFLALAPEATNVAMTWRLFGHNGVQDIRDDLVIAQFDHCAPRHCPKPHTVWGFKSMTRNIGAYRRLSCHRPNHLHADHADRVVWVNGDARPMGDEIKRRGWRSSMSTIGYQLLQLNHYALRSAESFLLKRQRGRALHVDRSIGLNYWIRMDWCDHRDTSIQRNIARTAQERDRLLADARLGALHRAALDWHRTKADALMGDDDARALFDQALSTRLSAAERAAYVISQDMES